MYCGIEAAAWSFGWDIEIEAYAGIDAKQSMRILLAILAGEVSGAGTETITFKDPAGTNTRVVATVDRRTDRTSVAVTPGNAAAGDDDWESEAETGITLRQAMAVCIAAAAGKLSGGKSPTISIKAAGGVAERISASVDEFGNRSNITLSLPSY